MSGRQKRPPVRLTLTRHEVTLILGALESLIEDCKYNGGLSLVEAEMALEEKLAKRLRVYDFGRAAA